MGRRKNNHVLCYRGAAHNLNNRSQSASLIDVKMFKGRLFRLSAVILRGGSMPTDLGPVSVGKRAGQAQAQTETTMLLFWLIICLGMLVLFFEVQ